MRKKIVQRSFLNLTVSTLVTPKGGKKLMRVNTYKI